MVVSDKSIKGLIAIVLIFSGAAPDSYWGTKLQLKRNWSWIKRRTETTQESENAKLTLAPKKGKLTKSLKIFNGKPSLNRGSSMYYPCTIHVHFPMRTDG